jgi:transcriptional regulator of acetoin/glycerol metabolism
VRRALEKTAWNKAKAARILGVGRQTLYRKLVEYNIAEPPDA